jgi:RHS repeat-associated protein
LKTGIQVYHTSSAYQTYDVLQTVLSSPSGFSVNSSRANSSQYLYTINETAQHADGVINVAFNVKLADSNDTITKEYTGFETYTIISAVVDSPSGFTVTNYYKSGDSCFVTVGESGSHNDGTYTVTLKFILYRNGDYGTWSPTFSVETIGNRWVDASFSSDLTASVDVSDDQTMTCTGNPDGTSVEYTGTPTELLVNLEGCFDNVIAISELENFIDFFDQNQAFEPAFYAYRDVDRNIDAYDTDFVLDIRTDLYWRPLGDAWFEYKLPSSLPMDTNYLFSVYLKNGYSDSETLAQSTYAIVNYSNRLVSGGGYVTAEETLTQAEDPDYNNLVYTDANLIAKANNDVIKTPSTSDPVSTVTGNMYHDETDFTIKGRGLNYAFTRSYNSAPAQSGKDGPLGYGWSHSYAMVLESNDYGSCPNCDSTQNPENENGITASISYTDERGGQHLYLIDESSNEVTSPAGEFDQLYWNSPSDGRYTIEFRNGTRYVFEGPADLHTVPGQTAKLVKIADPYGNELDFSYTDDKLTAITDNLGLESGGRSGLTLAYNAQGRLETISDWTGRTWTYNYIDDNLTGVTSPLGTITYTYHADSHLLNKIILPESRDGKQVETAFSYYEDSKTFNYINTLDEEESLDYDLFRQRTRVTDPRGFVREHHYDKDNGGLVKLKEPDGGILLFENNEDGLRYKKTDALGYQTLYAYNSSRTLDGAASDTYGNVTHEQDAYANTVDYDYGIYDQITRVKDKNGNERYYTYYSTTDSGTGAVEGKLEKVEAVIDSRTVALESYTYYEDGSLKQKIEFIDKDDTGKKRITDYVYQDNGLNLQSMTVTGYPQGDAYTVSFTYDSLSRKLTETLARRRSATDATLINLTTSYEYDSLGRIIRITDPHGNIQETVYDANGKVYQQKVHHKLSGGGYDIRTLVTNTYDAADRLVKTTDIDGFETRYKYDAAGNLIQVTDANNHTTRYEYDAKGRRTAVIDANGNRIETVFDLAGRAVKAIDANGNETVFEYDKLGRKTKEISSLGFETRYEYDANSNLVRMTDANAVAGLQPKNSQDATVCNEYDEFNRLTRTMDAMDGGTVYTYDLLGNVTSVTDAKGQTTEFIYDGLGRLKEVIDPIRETPTDKTTAFAYDEAGNLLTKTDRLGRTTRHTYDELNRLRQIEYLSDGTTTNFTYDDYSDLTETANADVTYTYGYDNQHRMVSKLDNRLGRNLAWAYDKVGNVIQKTDYQDEITHFQYDSTNRLVAERNRAYVQVSYHYDPAGRLLDRILSNGSKTSYQYDNDNRLVQLSNTSAGSGFAQTTVYNHDNTGNILTATDASGAVTYAYDALYRLTGADYPDTANDVSYTYDAVGNRLTRTKTSGTLHYIYNNAGNRLDEIRQGAEDGTVVYTYTYDNTGNRTEKRDSTGALLESYTYDQKNRIVSLDNQSEILSFKYDPNDYRIGKTTSAGTSKYLLEGEHYEAVYDQNDALKAKFLRGVVVDEIVYGYLEGKGHTFHHDHLQSVVGLSAHNGDVVETIQYGLFGETITSTGTSPNTLQYTGREFDEEIGLYYYRARYYDPEIGRFLNEDPLGFDAGINFYIYVLNPINFNDPEGKILAGGLGVVGGILLAKGIALGVSYLGIQSATHFAEHLTPAQLPEDPVTLGNRVWSGALEANRVQMQVAMELSPLDRAYDILGVVWGKELMGTYIDGGNFVIPDSGGFERSITGLLVSKEMKYSSLGDYYNSNAIKGIGTFFDIVEAGLSIKGAIDNTNMTRAWE